MYIIPGDFQISEKLKLKFLHLNLNLIYSEKKYIFLNLCQMMQTWSLSQMQIRPLNLIKNPVPVGFMYVELSGQPEPKTLWSNGGMERCHI